MYLVNNAQSSVQFLFKNTAKILWNMYWYLNIGMGDSFTMFFLGVGPWMIMMIFYDIGGSAKQAEYLIYTTSEKPVLWE